MMKLFWLQTIAALLLIFAASDLSLAKKNKDASSTENLQVQIWHPTNTTTIVSGQDLILMWTGPSGTKEQIYFQLHHVPTLAIMKKQFIAQLPTVGVDASRLAWKTPTNMTTDSRFQLTAYWARNGTLVGRSQLFAVIARKQAEQWNYPLDQPPVLPMTGPFDRRFFDLPLNGAGSQKELDSLQFAAVVAFTAAYLMI